MLWVYWAGVEVGLGLWAEAASVCTALCSRASYPGIAAGCGVVDEVELDMITDGLGWNMRLAQRRNAGQPDARIEYKLGQTLREQQADVVAVAGVPRFAQGPG